MQTQYFYSGHPRVGRSPKVAVVERLPAYTVTIIIYMLHYTFISYTCTVCTMTATVIPFDLAPGILSTA